MNNTPMLTFYTKLLKSLGVQVDETGQLVIVDNSDDENVKMVNLTYDSLPMVLPTKSNVSTVLARNNQGDIVDTKVIFNPLDETVICGDSKSLTKIKKLIDVRIGNTLALLTMSLLRVSANDNLQTDTTMAVNAFLVNLKDVTSPAVKKVVDVDTITKWIKLYTESLSVGNVKMTSTFIKKGGVDKTIKYNRLTTVKFPIYCELLKMTKGGKINGVTLRNKDVKVFKHVFEYIVNNITGRGTVVIGSMDKECPGLISSMWCYLDIMSKMETVYKSLIGVDPEVDSEIDFDLAITTKDLANLCVYLNEVRDLPRESEGVKVKLQDISRPGGRLPLARVSDNVAGSRVNQVNSNSVNNGNNNNANNSGYVNSSDLIKSLLYGSVSGVSDPSVNCNNRLNNNRLNSLPRTHNVVQSGIYTGQHNDYNFNTNFNNNQPVFNQAGFNNNNNNTGYQTRFCDNSPPF